MSLTELPSLLRDEPGLTRALGDPSARIAVAEVARPMAIAALAQLSGRRPLVVACPTGAERRPALRRPHASSCPTATSSSSRRGRRCRSSASARASRRWGSGSRCCGGCATRSAHPAIVVAGVRALLQKLGPGATTTEPIVVRPNAIVDPDELHRDTRRVRLPARGAGRAPRRVRPAGRDRRRLPVDRRRADPHRPVGRRGRPADDASASTTSARRSTSTR